MAVSLGFHMIFAALGIGMPLLMVLAEGLWLRTGNPHYRALAQKWSKATALLFVVGAVSGTALSFELGLLWPNFMAFAGSLIGPAFILEGYAFFLEAIFIGLYLYGWDRLPPRLHWWTGVAVALSGMLSGIFVLGVNAWMQHPVGFQLGRDGTPTDVDPVAVFRNPLWFTMALHSTLACYIATGFAAAGVYAWAMLHGRRGSYERSGVTIALAVGATCALAMPISGDTTAKSTAHYAPGKLAAMESVFETQKGAPLLIGGLPDPQKETVSLGVEIPSGLSLLVSMDPDSEVKGLKELVPDKKDWPDVVLVHLAFQVMVGCGFTLAGLGVWFGWSWWRGRWAESRWLLRALVVGGFLGFLALEAGWIVTEVGRQPWTIYQVMRTKDASTTAPEVVLSFFVFTTLYIMLGAALIGLLRQLARRSTKDEGQSTNH
jgi:cytochrome d ubiquinol oxidase subunit I